MSTHGKSTSAQKSLNYYGTLGGALSWGPWDWLIAIICNGNYIWQCGASPLDLTPAGGHVNSDGYVDLTNAVLDPTLFIEGGFLHFYPGTATANQEPEITWQPGFRKVAYFVAKGIFFGQNSGTAPNLQAIGGRVPQVPTTIVAAIDNIADDRQVNPVAALAEFLLEERGASLLAVQLDAPSWLAAAHWCAQDQAHRDYSFISPLFTEQTPVRDVVKQLLDPINGFLRWTSAGKLGCYIYEWGTDPGGLLTLDARHFSTGKPPKFTDGDWQDVPTEIVVGFTDRAYEWQANNVSVANQRAAEIRGVDDPQRLDRKHITRAKQAQSHGTEWIRRLGLAPGKGILYVRGPIVAGLQPGDKVYVDDDPEPGGAGLAQLCRIDKIETDRTDETTIEVTIDPLLPAVAYTPVWISPLPETLFAGAVERAPSLVHLLALPLPPAAFGWPPAVGFVATRPSVNLAGFHAYFATNPADPFAELGAQVGFAARCSLVNAVLVGDGTLRLQLLDGAAGPDAYLAADTPGGNAAAARDNTLLAVLVSLDGSGRVAIDGAGEPIMEFCSIVQRSAVTSDTHDYTVYRGVCSLAARAWGAAAVAWIVPKANLIPWQHELFSALFGAVGYFRLAAYTSAAIDETIPLPETDMVFPPAYASDLPVGYSVVLTSETIAIACDNAGTPLAGQLGIGGTAFTTVTVLRAGNPLAAVAAGPNKDQFSISIATLVAATATKTANDTVRADTLTADGGSIAIDILISGVFTIRKKLTLSKVKKGDVGADGAVGPVGPGLVYMGDYAGAETYYKTSERTDVVSSGGNYYPAANAAKSGTATWGAPGGADWGAAFINFKAVATDLLLARDATILKTLVMGDGATGNGGIIRSVSASAFLTGDGFWMNPRNGSGKTEFRVGNMSTSYLAFDGDYLTVGPSAGKHFRFAISGGVAELDLMDGVSNKGFWTFQSGYPTLDLGDAANAQLQNVWKVGSQLLNALSSADPRTTDAPLYAAGGAWIEKSLDVRGVGYFNTDLHVAGTLTPGQIGGASGGYSVGIDDGNGYGTLKLKYNGILDLPVIRVGATDFILVRAGGYTSVPGVTAGGVVTMKDSSGTNWNFLVQ